MGYSGNAYFPRRVQVGWMELNTTEHTQTNILKPTKKKQSTRGDCHLWEGGFMVLC